MVGHVTLGAYRRLNCHTPFSLQVVSERIVLVFASYVITWRKSLQFKSDKNYKIQQNVPTIPTTTHYDWS